MTSTEPGGAFALIDGALLGVPQRARPSLTVRVGRTPVRLSPEESRNALYGPRRDPALGAEVWRQAVAAALREPRGGEGRGRLFVVWLAIPGLYRNLYRILRHLRVERADLESEAVLGVLAALDKAEPDETTPDGADFDGRDSDGPGSDGPEPERSAPERPDPGGLIVKEAVNRMWAYAGRFRWEVPVVDVAAFAAARAAAVPPEGPPPPDEAWELHVTPPSRPDGLAATLCFAESRTRREGERIGALAHHAGLRDLVFRARRHEDAELLGTLVLRPAGGRR
ncbi:MULTISPECIES: hypothetical protein [unclassified Streptomyces]|uniref:hypothetical protein n=1 Tax=unclassified Streptomyces TaxID=2593676 RepID=UPI0006FF18AA|nr:MULTISPECIES: hypothetical protein [unclassified Streptomyces]KQX50816.1 hypothetical protein ASD33_12330 [Streptomyces sp. Root1304]KRA84981.1 hypothetical protein ASE09_12335 [Streptomyces sp. Root66D1]